MEEDEARMSDDLNTEDLNPLEEADKACDQVTSRPTRQAKRVRTIFSPDDDDEDVEDEDDDSNGVDDADWQPRAKKRYVTPKEKRTDVSVPNETAPSPMDDADPLSCNPEGINRGPQSPPTRPKPVPLFKDAAQKTGPLYKDAKRKTKQSKDAEEDIIQSDDLLYCLECSRDYDGDCPEHGPVTIIEDLKMPSLVSDAYRAKKTAPSVVSVADSKIPGAESGVWARETIQPRTRFGPYGGNVVPPDSASSYSWLIRKDGKPSHCVDAAEPGLSNWMRYVNLARHEGESNLHAYQYKGNIYYQTKCRVNPHEELLLWNGHDSGGQQGATAETTNDKAPETFKETVFKCPACPYAYASPLYLERHKKYCRKLHGPRQKSAPCDSPKTNNASTAKQPKAKQPKAKQPKAKQPRAKPVNTRAILKSQVPVVLKTIISTNDAKMLEVTVIPSDRPVERKQSVSVPPSKRDAEATINPSDRPVGQKQQVSVPPSKPEQLISSPAATNSSYDKENPYSCTECNEQFSHEETLASHLLTHAGENPLVCCVCSERFFDKETLTNHLRIHSGDDTVVCYECNEVFYSNQNYSSHIAKHSAKCPYRCVICSQRFVREDSRDNHMLTHEQEPTLKCSFCERKFSTIISLTRHSVVHQMSSLKRPFQCDICDREFEHELYLKRHLTTHANKSLRAFACSQCDKTFGNSRSLESHEQRHRDNPIAPCSLCGVILESQARLQLHLKWIHCINVAAADSSVELLKEEIDSDSEDSECLEDSRVDITRTETKEIEVSEMKFDSVPQILGTELDETLTVSEPKLDCGTDVKPHSEVEFTQIYIKSEHDLLES